MDWTSFFVVGERCSGTNAMKNAIKNHYPNLTSFYEKEILWKHEIVKVDMSKIPPDVFCICMTRHPVDWVHSFFHKPYHVDELAKSWKNFVTHQWSNEQRELYAENRPFHDLLELRSVKLKALRNFPRSIFVKQENLRDDPIPCIDRIAAHFGLTKPDHSNCSCHETAKPAQTIYIPNEIFNLLNKSIDWNIEYEIGQYELGRQSGKVVFVDIDNRKEYLQYVDSVKKSNKESKSGDSGDVEEQNNDNSNDDNSDDAGKIVGIILMFILGFAIVWVFIGFGDYLLSEPNYQNKVSPITHIKHKMFLY